MTQVVLWCKPNFFFWPWTHRFIGILTVFSYYVSSDTDIWTAWTLNSMYSIYNYLKIENNFLEVTMYINGLQVKVLTQAYR